MNGPLRSYGALGLPPPPRRQGDAEFLDDDAYGANQGMPNEEAPVGLMDRLYQEQLKNQPVRNSVPTTKNRF